MVPPGLVIQRLVPEAHSLSLPVLACSLLLSPRSSSLSLLYIIQIYSPCCCPPPLTSAVALPPCTTRLKSSSVYACHCHALPCTAVRVQSCQASLPLNEQTYFQWIPILGNGEKPSALVRQNVSFTSLMNMQHFPSASSRSSFCCGQVRLLTLLLIGQLRRGPLLPASPPSHVGCLTALEKMRHVTPDKICSCN